MQAQRQDAPISWIMTLLTCAYVIWCAFSLSRRVPVFAKLFAGLGAEMPAITSIMLAICTPALLGSGCVIVVGLLAVKEFTFERLSTRVAISVSVLMATALFAAVATESMFEPLLRLISRVGGG